MLIIKAEELEAQGSLYPSATEFVFQGKVLVGGLTLSDRFMETAIDLCQAELSAGNFCLLVTKFNYVTLFKERTVEPSKASKPSAIAPPINHQPRADQPSSLNQREAARKRPDELLTHFPAGSSPRFAKEKHSENGHLTHSSPGNIALASENSVTSPSVELIERVSPPPAESSSQTLETPVDTPPQEISTPEAEQPPALDPAFLEHCLQTLTDCIGPIAPLILDEFMANHEPSTPTQLIDLLTRAIPDPQAAQEFLNRLELPPDASHQRQS